MFACRIRQNDQINGLQLTKIYSYPESSLNNTQVDFKVNIDKPMLYGSVVQKILSTRYVRRDTTFNILWIYYDAKFKRS